MAINGITIQPTPEPSAPRQGQRAGAGTPVAPAATQPDNAANRPVPQVEQQQEISRQVPVQAPDQRSEQAAEAPSVEALEALVERIGEQLINIDRRSISFRIHQDIGRTIVSVIDIDTEEVIRQIPSDELVRIAEVLQEINSQRNGGGDTLDSAGLLIQDSV